MAKRTRIIEGTWDCTSCGTKAIPGRHSACPSCGNPRDTAAETRFDFGAETPSGASAKETVTDPALLARARAGADWFCAFCRAGNPGDATACRTCSAPREERPLAPGGPQTLASQPATVLPARPSAQGRRLFTLGCAGGLTLLAAFVAVGVWGSRTRDLEGRVVERTWRREIVQERFSAVAREGWKDELTARSTVMPVRGLGEVAGVERIRECATRQRGTRRVADGTREVCEDRTRRVQCGTEERCRKRDLGNGFAEEVCEDVPKYCDESYRDCRNETRYREEPVYGILCRYDTWEWQPAGSFQAGGRDDAPRWPVVTPGSRDRERRSESYEAVVEYDVRGKTKRHTVRLADPGEYERWERGRVVAVTATNFGHVKDVRLRPD